MLGECHQNIWGPRLHHRGLDTSLQDFVHLGLLETMGANESTSSWLSYKTRMSEISLTSQAKDLDSLVGHMEGLA